MICEQYSRTAMLIGEEAVEKLKNSRAAVFGAGGVGGYAIEALARCGVGTIDIFDDDKISVSNLNRQIIALNSTVGMYKTDAMAARIHDIDPSVTVNTHRMFFMPQNADQVDFTQYDAVIDAIDTVSGKLEIAERCIAAGTFVISSMGTGNKLDPTKLTVCDIYETSVCPLARVMRRELKKRDVKALRVVYSTEPALPRREIETTSSAEESPLRSGKPKTNSPGSISFVPSAAGLIAASEVIKHLIADL